MENILLIEDKYLFKLNLVKPNISVMDYINKTIDYENNNQCHVNNKNFHDKTIQYKIME